LCKIQATSKGKVVQVYYLAEISKELFNKTEKYIIVNELIKEESYDLKALQSL